MVLIPGCDLSPAAPGGGGDTLTFARTPATLLRHLRHQQRSPELDTNLRKIKSFTITEEAPTKAFS